ncbi:hypothetical protein ACVWYN_000341 [Pedobacter sp. UYP24]
MKRGFFSALVAVMCFASAKAQTLKTGVLVVGNGINAIGAGVQSAKSGVSTTILLTEAGFNLAAIDTNASSGMERDFLKATKKNSLQSNVNDLLKLWTDTIKNLTITKNASWTKFKRSGGGWVVELKDGKAIKAKILVDADQSGKLKEALQFQYPAAKWQPLNYTDNLYRTSISSCYNGDQDASILSLYQLMIPEQDNLIALDCTNQHFSAGQAAGATAAYAAFFNRKTSESGLKNIQGELINFKLSLIPFTDVTDLDSNWKAIQFVGLSGILKAEFKGGKAFFNPESKVSSQEIRQPFKDYFYKAQIWFDDYKSEQMTIGSTLDLICYTGSKKPETTKAEVVKNWKKLYGFKSSFDEKRVITRREFSALLNSYNNPFNVIVDKTGRITR